LNIAGEAIGAATNRDTKRMQGDRKVQAKTARRDIPAYCGSNLGGTAGSGLALMLNRDLFNGGASFIF
jgi:hypothetical protein